MMPIIAITKSGLDLSLGYVIVSEDCRDSGPSLASSIGESLGCGGNSATFDKSPGMSSTANVMSGFFGADVVVEVELDVVEAVVVVVFAATVVAFVADTDFESATLFSLSSTLLGSETTVTL